jgi:hypothetical protein
MFMLESPVAISAMTKNHFLNHFIDSICEEKDYFFVKRIIRSTFVIGKYINYFFLNNKLFIFIKLNIAFYF